MPRSASPRQGARPGGASATSSTRSAQPRPGQPRTAAQQRAVYGASPQRTGGTGRPGGPGGPSRPGGRRPAPRRRGRAIWKALGILVLLGLVGVAALAVVVGVAYAHTTVPDPQAQALKATTTVLYKDGSVMGTFPTAINRTPLTADAMPKVAKQAAVASEDRSFYTNSGVSLTGIARAVKGVITHQSDLGGGSTITQQYVKNMRLQTQHTYSRKASEALIALKLSKEESKDEILTNYLNTIYFGRSSYGVAAAAAAYFGVTDPSQLTFQQAALLIAIVPSPNNWDPAKDPTIAQKRYTYVLSGMVAMKDITQAQADQSAKMPATIAPATATNSSFNGTNGYLMQAAQYEVDQDLTDGSVLRALGYQPDDKVAPETAGLTITTTIDPKLQQDAVAAMADTQAFPTRGRPAGLQAGLVSVDPTSGGVLSLYGGPDWQQNKFDTVRLGKAQPGSTFKAFTLIGALEKGIPLSTTFSGANSVTIKGTTYHNDDKEAFGDINLVTALANSVNTVFIQLNEEVGADKTAAIANQMGVTANISKFLNDTLGTTAVKPIDMATAYATIASGGVRHKTHFIASISRSDAAGKHVYTTPTTGTQVVDPKIVADLEYAMQQVVKRGTATSNVGHYFGRRPVAGKTGTTDNNVAAWFNGFTPQMETVAVLYGQNPQTKGNETIKPFGGYQEISGGTVPAAIWRSYMLRATAGLPVVQFPAPSQSALYAPPSATPTDSASASASASATSDGGQGGNGNGNGPNGNGPNGPNGGQGNGPGNGQNGGQGNGQNGQAAGDLAGRPGTGRPGVHPGSSIG